MSQKMSKFFKNLKKSLISTKRKLEFSKECLKKYPTVLLHKKNDRFGFEFKFFIEDFLKAKDIDENSIKLFFDENFVEITEDLITGDLNKKIGVFTRSKFINKLYDFLVEVKI